MNGAVRESETPLGTVPGWLSNHPLTVQQDRRRYRSRYGVEDRRVAPETGHRTFPPLRECVSPLIQECGSMLESCLLIPDKDADNRRGGFVSLLRRDAETRASTEAVMTRRGMRLAVAFVCATTLAVGTAAGQAAYVAAGHESHACAVTPAAAWCVGGSIPPGSSATARRQTAACRSGDAASRPGCRRWPAGDTFSCALSSSGGVVCWGSNAYGQLGDGTTTDRLTPVQVSGLASGVRAIGAGAYHTCALLTGGAVRCWG